MPNLSKAEREQGFHTVKWKTFDLFQCNTCHYNTMIESQIKDHVEMATENNERLANELGVDEEDEIRVHAFGLGDRPRTSAGNVDDPPPSESTRAHSQGRHRP